mmetsp:Transcript_36931/g.85185  ORF Transcript_36931/g.85185 Transcript_36931/m.85185 type:complete len:254 (-) Transcript_36931:28-789(-)
MPRQGNREQDSCGAAASFGKHVAPSFQSGVTHASKRQFKAQQQGAQSGTSTQDALLGWSRDSSCSTPRRSAPRGASRQAESYEVATTLLCASRAAEELTPEKKKRGFSHHLRSSGVEDAMHWKKEAFGHSDAVAGYRGTRSRQSEIRAPFGGERGTPTCNASHCGPQKRSGSCPLSSYADTFGCSPANRSRGPGHPAGSHIAEVATLGQQESQSPSLQLVRLNAAALSRELCRFHDSPHRHGRSFAPPPRSPS